MLFCIIRGIVDIDRESSILMPNSHRPTRCDKIVLSRRVGSGDVNWALVSLISRSLYTRSHSQFSDYSTIIVVVLTFFCRNINVMNRLPAAKNVF